MAYILQNIEIKKASQKLVDFVKKLGEEKHARMVERKLQREEGNLTNVDIVYV